MQRHDVASNVNATLYERNVPTGLKEGLAGGGGGGEGSNLCASQYSETYPMHKLFL